MHQRKELTLNGLQDKRPNTKPPAGKPQKGKNTCLMDWLNQKVAIELANGTTIRGTLKFVAVYDLLVDQVAGEEIVINKGQVIATRRIGS